MSEEKHIETIARGVCVADGKILLCFPKDRSYAYLPGGHIEFGETGRGVVESSFVQKGEQHCEINLIYKMGISGQGSGIREEIMSCEDWICFDWIDCDKIDSVNLLPPEMKPYCYSSPSPNP